MIRALLVDDELNNLNNLAFYLENEFNDVEVLAKFDNGADAREWLLYNTIDVIFLDISMPGEDGFEMLAKIENPKFKVVFVTAYDTYAVQAIRANALDFIVKPLHEEDLENALNKVREMMRLEAAANMHQDLLKHLLQSIQLGHETPQRIAIPNANGVTLLEVNDIIAIEADGNYTYVYRKNMEKLLVSKTLKEFEEVLDEKLFFRAHKSHIINLNYVVGYSNNEGGMVKMVDGNTYSISRRQNQYFVQKIKENNVSFF